MKTASIIAIGNELVEGIIVDTNSKYISKKLLEYGYKTKIIKTLPDDLDLLVKEIKDSLETTDLVVTTGGLGPTEDDLTREAVSKALEKKIIFDENLSKKIIEKAKKFHSYVPKIVERQAMVIEDATVLENPVGTAPGMLLKTPKSTILILPGPPVEMIPIFEEALNLIEKENKIYQRRIKTINIPEAVLVEKYKDIIYKYKEVNVATMASHTSGVELRFTGEKALVDEIVNMLSEKLKDYIYAFDDKTIEEIVFEKLLSKNKTVSFAESCTGGLVSANFVNLSGVSKVFKGSIVAYSNEVKQKLLNVNPKTLEKFGAVSKECVEEMAKGVSKLLDTDYSVAISGIAGPTGGTKEKPVGTVWICAYSRENDIFMTERFYFKGNRQTIRNRSTLHAFDMLRRILKWKKEVLL